MSRRLSRRYVGILLLVLMCLTSIPRRSLGGSGSLTHLPYSGTKIRNGIMAEVDGRWLDGWGYRPITVTLQTQRARADRTIRAVIMPNSWSKHRVPYAVAGNIEIPQGSSSVSKTLYVPQQERWHQLRIEFFEEGRKLEDLSMEHGMSWNVQYWRSGDIEPTLLMVDNDAPTFSDRSAFISQLKADRRQGAEDTFLLPDANAFGFMIQNDPNRDTTHDEGRVSDLESLELLEKVPAVEIIPGSQLPDQYIGLSSVDLVLIPFEDLEWLAEAEKERFKALKRHIQNGGNLIVHGNSETILSQVAALMGMRRDTWRAPDRGTYQPSTDAWRELMEGDQTYYTPRPKSGSLESSEPPDFKVPDFRVGPLALGQVTVIRSEDPFEFGIAAWQWVFRTMGMDRLTWMKRHGVSHIQNNTDYWNFMIPGFGAAPVKSFLATISLFIIAIGPVNYYLLKRSRRLYLLPITVGGAAMATTIGMLCYAIASDGISTRVRLRSFTYLDQVENVAATHCRHAYLAAIAPSEGLSFPARTCVYPFVPFQGNKRRREVQNDRAEVRQLTHGYIRSRSTTQFLTTEVQDTRAGLTIDRGQGELRVTPRLGTHVTHLWLWDEEGRLYSTRDMPDGSTAVLRPVEAQVAREQLEQLLLAHRPQAPPGLDQGVGRNMLGMLGYRARGSSIPAKSRTSLLEKGINTAGECFTQPVSYSYLVVTEKKPAFISVGTEAGEEAGFHIVRGVWKRP